MEKGNEAELDVVIADMNEAGIAGVHAQALLETEL